MISLSVTFKSKTIAQCAINNQSLSERMKEIIAKEIASEECDFNGGMVYCDFDELTSEEEVIFKAWNPRLSMGIHSVQEWQY